MDAWLADDLAVFGLCADGAKPVPGGWLNEKWHIPGVDGGWLVKRYSPQRFGEQRLNEIEAALARQAALAEAGFPCPSLLRAEGRLLRRAGVGRAYAVMRFCRGQMPVRGELTSAQLESIGEVCGHMHRALAAMPPSLSSTGAKGYPAASKGYLTALRTHFAAEQTPAAPPSLRQVIAAGREIVKSCRPAELDRIPRGAAHEDFSPDNLLIGEEGVCAVLDFDRSSYGLRLHDLGRALISLTLGEGERGIDPRAASAILHGYTRHYPLSAEEVCDTLRCVWYVEATWWLNPACFGSTTEKVTRFRDELIWLTMHWDTLASVARQLG